MKKYIGVEHVQSEPMTRGDYNVYRGWTIPPDENPSDEGYLVKRDNGHINWIPKEIFEKTYEELDSEIETIIENGMSFDELKESQAQFGFELALTALKYGYNVARSGWNGKGMYIQYCKGKDHEHAIIEPFLVIKNVKNSFNTWVPSISDLMSNDWVVV